VGEVVGLSFGNIPTINFDQVSNVSQIKSNSNVVMEYKLSTRDYEIEEPRVAIDSTLSVGGYTVSASSTFNSGSTGTYGPWGAFNKLHDAYGWSSDGHGSSTDTYSTSNGSQLLNVLHHAGSALGEWIQLDMPSGILLKSVDIQSRAESGRSTEEGFPKNVYLYGSTDNSTWSLIKNFTAAPKKGDRAEIHNELVSVQVEYKHFALVTNSVYVGAGNYPAVGIGEIRYYGTPFTADVATGTDVVLHTTPNVPKTNFSNVYYDGQDYTSMPATVADKSGNGLTGTPSGGVGFDSTYKAFTFDGSSQYITGAHGLPTGSVPVHTISLWLNATETTDYTYAVQLGQGGTSHQQSAIIFYENKISHAHWGSGVLSDVTIAKNVWYHVVAVFTGGNGSDLSKHKIFINGEDGGVGPFPGSTDGPVVLTGSQLTLGRSENGGGTPGNYFNGSIANFRLYNRALSAEEIWELYAYQKEYFGVSPDVVTLKAGRVGIGTSEPRAVLDVRGDIRGGCPVYFEAHRDAANNTGGDPIRWNVVVLNKGGGYNPSTGLFTAPISGVYNISFSAHSSGGAMNVRLTRNGSEVDGGWSYVNAVSYNTSKSMVFNLKQGETVGVRLNSGGFYGLGYNNFSGFYISS
jgi:hypothetical protein